MKRRKPDKRKKAIRTTEKVYFIATEGEKTEEIYFDIFKAKKFDKNIKIFPAHKGKSSPESVMKRIKKVEREYDLRSHDELWLIIDSDKWEDRSLVKP